jgi:hypothetical protein
MDWLLFLYSDNNFDNIKFVFSGVELTETYKEFVLSDFENFQRMEQKIIDVMNFHVAIRDNVYLICNLREQEDIYKLFCDNFPNLSNRIRSGLIDTKSFFITSEIMKRLKC